MGRKLAAIDIGTNSFHLVVVEITNSGNFEIIDSVKEVIRLGEGSSGDIKFITEESIQRAINGLNKFVGIAKSHNAEIKAVATSAVRESTNKIEVIKKIYKESGIKIDVISGIEEGRLIYLGVLQAVPVYDKRVLCIDIGGGSTEFVLGYKGKILYANSLKLGAVRMTKKFFSQGIVTQDAIARCVEWVEGVLYPVVRELNQYKIDMVVGSSGTIMAAGLMIKAMEEGSISTAILNNYKFNKKSLLKISKQILESKTTSQRKKIKGLDPKRADIIPAGMIILSTIFKEFNISQMTISGYALREGIIFDTLNKQNEDSKHRITSNIRNESVEKLAQSCKFDYSHCKHVAKLAEQLFDDLSELHKLPHYYKEYLIVAAKLHDVGFHIAHSKHHKHSQYIIVNSELLGFNENEIRTIACIARYHRKSHPKNSHYEYSLLTEEWKIIAKKLSAILRIADALDRTHNSRVKNIKTVTTDNNVNIIVDSKLKDIEIEIWSLDRKKKLFEEVYSKNIIVKSV